MWEARSRPQRNDPENLNRKFQGRRTGTHPPRLLVKAMKTVARNILPPLLVFVVFIAAWALFVKIADIAEFVLPGPDRVFEKMIEHRQALLKATLSTGIVALAGFGLSLVVGCLSAFVMAQTRMLERCFYPYAIFLQTVPIIAIAPIIIIWLGPGVPSIICVSFIISLFPVITNATAGLANPPREYLELLRVYDASWWKTLVKVRIPAAVPYIITGARISAGLSVVGAIVGEYFTSMMNLDYGIAYLVIMNAENARTAYLFATTLMSALLGLVIFAGVSLAGNLILRRGHYQQGE